MSEIENEARSVLNEISNWIADRRVYDQAKSDVDRCAGRSGPRDGCRMETNGPVFCHRHRAPAFIAVLNAGPGEGPSLESIRARFIKAFAKDREGSS